MAKESNYLLVATGGHMELSKNTKRKIKELLDICKSKQGEYLPSNHGSGSWATTYSNEFVDASCDLYMIFERAGALEPMSDLSKLFRESGIRSCRGSEFILERVEYLYSSHLHFRLEQLKELRKPKTLKINCCYCDKKIADIVQHVSQAHPEKWETFFADNKIDLKGKTRCKLCGCFLKSMAGHEDKCLKSLL